MQKPSDLRAIWDKGIALAWEYLQKEPSLEAEIEVLCSDIPIGKEEYALGARYLHRGFYCPSPIYDKVVVNARRGRIAKRMTKASRPTNRYEFDLEGKLRISETIYPNGSMKTEFIFYEDDVIFGLTYDRQDYLSMLTVERYSKGRITSYWKVNRDRYSPNERNQVSSVSYECYRYNGDIMEADVYFDLMEFKGRMLGSHWKGRFMPADHQVREVFNWHLVKD